MVDTVDPDCEWSQADNSGLSSRIYGATDQESASAEQSRKGVGGEYLASAEGTASEGGHTERGTERANVAPEVTPFALLVIGISSIGGLLFGYDIGVIGGTLVMPSFRREMGWPEAPVGGQEGECHVDGGREEVPEAPATTFDRDYLPSDHRMLSSESATSQAAWIVSSFLLGCAVAAPWAGWCTDRFGRKRTVTAGGLVFGVGGLAQAVSQSYEVLVIGRFLAGIAIGVLSMAVPLMIAELAPAGRRGQLVALQQLMITVGIFLAFLLNLLLAPLEAGWRICLAVQVAFAVVLVVGMAGIPESPRWLLSQHRGDEALAALLRLRSHPALARAELAQVWGEVAPPGFCGPCPGSLAPTSDPPAAPAAAAPPATQRGQEASWREVLSRRHALVLCVGCGITGFQQLTGINAILYYAPSMFQHMCQAPFLANLIIGVINIASTVASMALIDRVGRKVLLSYGTVSMGLTLVALAVLLRDPSLPARSPPAAHLAIALMSLFIASFGVSWGPLGWVLPSELFPLRIRGRAVGLTTMTNWVLNFAVGMATPRLMQRADLAGTFLFFAAFLALAFPLQLLFVPETRGRELEAVEEVFHAPSLGAFMRANAAQVCPGLGGAAREEDGADPAAARSRLIAADSCRTLASEADTDCAVELIENRA